MTSDGAPPHGPTHGGLPTYLADPTHCPSCAAALTPARDICPVCGITLSGPVAARLWQVSVQAADLLETRRQLLGALRRTPAPAAAPAPGASAAAAPAPSPSTLRGHTAATASPGSERNIEDQHPAWPPPAGPPAGPPARDPEWSRRKVQNTLLALGVGLLGVAAIIFVAVSWDRLGVGGRSAVMAGVTAMSGFAAYRTYRRGLRDTTEALSLLTVVLALLDCFGARSSNLAGFGSFDGEVYWAGALAVVAVAAGLGSTVLRTRTLRLAAAALGQLPAPVLVGGVLPDIDQPFALLATALTAQTVGALGLVAAWPGSSRSRDARAVVAAGGVLAYVVAALSAYAAAYGEDGSLVPATALLLVLAAVLAIAGTVAPPRLAFARPVLDGLTAVIVVFAVWAPAEELTAMRWTAPTISALATALVAAGLLVPTARRTVPVVVALVAAVLPALAATNTLADALTHQAQPVHTPWAHAASAVPVIGSGPDTVVLLVAGAALALGAYVLRWTRALAAAAIAVLSVGAATVAPAVGAGFPLALSVQIALAAVLLVGGALLDIRGRVVEGWTALGAGSVLLGLATSWSLATDVVNLVALPAVAVTLLVGALATRGGELLRPWRVALVVSAVLVATAEASAIARYDGAGWPAVWSLALSLLVIAALVDAAALTRWTTRDDAFWSPLHTAGVVVAGGALVADTGALAHWAGTDLAGAGLGAAVTAAVLLALTVVPLLLPVPLVTERPVRGAVQVVAAVAAVPALVAAAVDGDRLWLALLAVGLGLAFVAVTPQRHLLGWGAGVVLAGSSWVRLALSDVDAPEAYTVPGGVALLVVGALRRRQDPAYRSWRAYGSGLTLALVPSLLRAVTDAGNTRPLLLGLAAAAVLAVGAARRLQAPVVIGAGVLAVDAIVQLAPHLVEVYDVVPRWATIGLLGLALLGAGATYEARVRDLRRVGRHVAGLA